MLRGLWVLFVLGIITIVLAIPAIAVSLVRPGSDITMRLGKVWSRLLLAAAGVRPEYEGVEHLTERLPCIYMCNHLSLLDILVLAPVLPVATRFVAKRSLSWVPFFGWSLAASGFIFIDRKNRTRAIRSLSRAATKIRAGRPVVLFPEGTRSRTGTLGPFKRGAFRLALQASVPVVPIAISGTGRVIPPDSIRVHPGPVRVRAAAPLDVTPYEPEDLGGIMDAVRREISRRLNSSEAALDAAMVDLRPGPS